MKNFSLSENKEIKLPRHVLAKLSHKKNPLYQQRRLLENYLLSAVLFAHARKRENRGKITPPSIFPTMQISKYTTALPEKPRKKIYNVFATEWSKPQNANTTIGNITPTVVDRPFRGAYLTEPMESVIKKPHKTEEVNAFNAQFSAFTFADIILRACGTMLSAKKEFCNKSAVATTPSILQRKQTGSFQRFFTPISGMSDTNPVNSFISYITMVKIANENNIAPTTFPHVPNNADASKKEAPPIPITIPEQIAIKQNENTCAFVIFSIVFMIHLQN